MNKAKKYMNRMLVLTISLLLILTACSQNKQNQQVEGDGEMTQTSLNAEIDAELEYQQGPADNPLKGFVPYKGKYGFPHSMEWWYISLSDLMNGPDSYTFDTGLEPVLDEIASRGHQAVFRVYVEYPGKPLGVPQFLLDEGLKLYDYTDFGGGQDPDYHDPKLIKALEDFIEEFGRRYDGDPRIGFITCGLIGHWGEWHTYPNEERMPSVEDQNRLFAAYDKAFNTTKVLARYPNSGDVAQMNIGFHDDSFAYSTLKGASWHFMNQMEQAKAEDQWKREAIGGELRPEVQISIWGEELPPEAEDFNECVDVTHATWLMAHGVFTKLALEPEKYKKALEGAKKLGYDLYIPRVQVRSIDGGFDVTVQAEDKGAAPFYYNWTVQLGVVDASNNLAGTWDTEWKLTSILPGEPQEFKYRIGESDLKSGTYKLLLRVVNPLPEGKNFRFANAEQDKDLEGWLSLCSFEVE